MIPLSLKRSLWVLLAVLCLTTAVISVSLALSPTAETPTALDLSLTTFATGLNNPVAIANADAGYGRLFVVEQPGYIRIVEPDGTVLPTPFLDIHTRVTSGGELGLLGLAFHPNYYDNGYFYVNYTSGSGANLKTRISRFSVTSDPTIADPDSEDILLTVVQPDTNHNAGDIHFGADGYLYIPLGDGGGGGDTNNYAQNLNLALGKILRIDVNTPAGVTPPECNNVGGSNHFTIPASNPFVGSDGTCDLIWAIGLRNPWRSSFDRLTGDLFLGDVGQGSWEEANHQSADSTGGENYGWRCYEGNHPFNISGCGPMSDYTFPIFEFVSTGNCSVIGGYVYRGTQYPAMYGHYLVTDYCSGNFWDLVVDDTGLFTPTMHTNLTAFGYVTFGERADCELYLANIINGTVYHIQENTLLAQSNSGSALCNNRPVATADSYQTIQEQTLVVKAPGVLANDSDLDGDVVTAVLETPPLNGSVSFNADGSFTYTPTVGFSGVDSFAYRALDGFDESSLVAVTITVEAVNVAPVATNDVYTTTWNVPFSVAAPGILDNDSDADGDTLTAVLDTPPSNGDLSLSANGSLIYTPTANFTGTDSFAYHANDGVDDSNTATVLINVVVGNAPPVAISDHYTTTEDIPLTIDPPGVLINDSDPNGDELSAFLNSPPVSGTLTLHLDGSFTYTPSLDFVGLDSFTYYANDGQDNSLQPTTVLLAVTTAVNQAPTAGDDVYVTSLNTPLTVAAPGVLSNDSDPELQTVTATVETAPVTGTLLLHPDGAFVYTPTLGFTGNVTFTYRAFDGQLYSNVALVTIEVTPFMYTLYLPFVVAEP